MGKKDFQNNLCETSLVVQCPPSKAGDAGSIPGQGTKIPHAAGQLSPRASTTELAGLN